jgi:small-conductance mechanosensitive channel
VRAILREELERQAAADAAEMAEDAAPFVTARARLLAMYERINTRAMRWVERIANISERFEEVEKRLATASGGATGMVLSVVGMIAAGVAAALATSHLFRRPRQWLREGAGATYAERLLRSLALFTLQALPIAAFVFLAELAASLLKGSLGPLTNWVWIFVTGVCWSWLAIVVVRRLFSPDWPQLRLASASDGAAQRIFVLVRRSVLVGLAGWLVAGLSPTLGFGFPPAMVTVASAGALVIGLLVYAVLRHAPDITAAVLAPAPGQPARQGETEAVDWRGALAAIAPYALMLYILGAGTYWLLHWLERGQERLDGPVGSLCIILLLPVLDRVGDELTAAILRRETGMAIRFRAVLKSAWRVAIGLASTAAVFALWGVDLLQLSKGARAPAWASAAFDIAITMMIGLLIWRLIRAALHTEVRESQGAEDFDPSNISSATRLDTLVPLFRNVLLGLLVITVAMIVLSALGVDIGPLIASAGIIGIAIGFGAQTLVRDIFSGIFFLVDDAFRVGEYIELDDEMRGEVEAISIRSLQLRHHRGAVITIPFGELKQITNHNRDWVIYKMSYRMEPDTDPQKFKKVVKAVGKEFLEHPEHGPKFLEPLKSQGVYYVDDDSALVMRVKFKCYPRAQFVLRREIYHRLRTVFEENGLHVARRKVEVVTGGEDDPNAASIPPGSAGGAAHAEALEQAMAEGQAAPRSGPP